MLQRNDPAFPDRMSSVSYRREKRGEKNSNKERYAFNQPTASSSIWVNSATLNSNGRFLAVAADRFSSQTLQTTLFR